MIRRVLYPINIFAAVQIAHSHTHYGYVGFAPKNLGNSLISESPMHWILINPWCFTKMKSDKDINVLNVGVVCVHVRPEGLLRMRL